MATLKVLNPFDQSVVCDWTMDTPKSLAAKLDGAEKAYQKWHRLPLDERISQVREGLKRFRAGGAETVRQITLQMGKPLAQSEREVETFFERAEYMVSIAKGTLSPEILPHKEGFLRRIEHRPLGIV